MDAQLELPLTRTCPVPPELIREELDARGISVSELSKAAGIDRPFLTAILANRSPLGVASAVRISLALGHDHRHLAIARARFDAYIASHDDCAGLLPVPLPTLDADEQGLPPPEGTAADHILRFHLRLRRTTIAAASRALGISLTNTANIVRGERPISARLDRHFAHWLGLPAGIFLIAQAIGRADAFHDELLKSAPSSPMPRPARPRAAYDHQKRSWHLGAE